MKIGIITFWQTRDNYGQMLQCWALQHYLITLGHEPFLIRYRHSEIYEFNLKLSLKRFVKNVITLRWSKLLPESRYLPPETAEESCRGFELFKKEYLSLSDNSYSSIKELRLDPPAADCYIVGSDQVWSKLLYYDECRAFFLDFGEEGIKRIAYAASFSISEYPADIQKKLSIELSRFNSISVREKTGVSICNKAGYKAELVLDPTMLLYIKDYVKCFDLCSQDRKDIFIYSLNISNADEIGWAGLLDYSRANGLKIKVTTSSGYIKGGKLFPNVVYEYSKIPEWITNIINSKLVVTTSFHGIVFCLLSHTPFVYVPLEGKYARGNNRVLDLFSCLHITGRLFSKTKSYQQIAEEEIDWEVIDSNLDKLRKNSYKFLDEALKI